MLGREPSDARAAAAVRGVRRQPVLPGAVGPRVRRRGSESARADVRSSELRVPAMVVAALSEELALLSAGSRRVLQGASVAGDPFEPELAAAASDVGEPEAMDAIDELLERRPDPTDQRASALSLPPSDRPARRLRGLAGRLAHRSARTRRPGPRRPWRRRPGSRPAHRRLRQGRRHGRRRRAHRGRPAVRPARAGDSRAMVLRRAAPAAGIRRPPLNGSSCSPPPPLRWRRPAASPKPTRRSRKASDSLDADATALRVRLVAACARVEHLLGRHEQAHERLAAALEDLPDAAGAAAVSLMLELAADEVYRLRYQAGQAWAQQAVDAAKAIGDPALEAAALATLARAFVLGRRAGPRRAGARRGDRDRWTRLTDEQLAGRLDAAVELAGAEIYLDRFVEAAAHAERALAVGRATGQGQLFPGIYATLGVARCMLGRLADAAELLDAAIEAARLSGHPPALAWALFCRAFVAVPAGDLKTAIAAAQESFELATEANQAVIAARAASILAVALLDAGESDRAAAVLAGPLGEQQFGAIPAVWRAYLLELMTRCWLALGRRDEAAAAAAGAHASAAAVGLRSADSDGLPCDRRRRPGRRGRCHGRTAGAARGRSRRRRRHAGRGRPRPHHRRPGAGRARRQRPRNPRARTGSRRARPLRRRALPRRGATRTAPARPAHPPAHPAGRLDQWRERVDRSRAGDRRADRRPQDQRRDRPRAVPQQEDRRDAHPQHVPQARRQLSGRHRSRDGSRRPRFR